MNQDNKEEFFNLITHLSELYPYCKVDEARKRAYFEHLQDIPMHRIRTAIKRAVGKHERFPSASQLRSLAGVSDESGAGGVHGWRATKEYLRSIHGDDYYADDYEEGVRLWINRPLEEVLADEVNRGWRSQEDADRILAERRGSSASVLDLDVADAAARVREIFNIPPQERKTRRDNQSVAHARSSSPIGNRCEQLALKWEADAKNHSYRITPKDEAQSRLKELFEAFEDDRKDAQGGFEW